MCLPDNSRLTIVMGCFLKKREKIAMTTWDKNLCAAIYRRGRRKATTPCPWHFSFLYRDKQRLGREESAALPLICFWKPSRPTCRLLLMMMLLPLALVSCWRWWATLTKFSTRKERIGLGERDGGASRRPVIFGDTNDEDPYSRSHHPRGLHGVADEHCPKGDCCCGYCY